MRKNIHASQTRRPSWTHGPTAHRYPRTYSLRAETRFPISALPSISALFLSLPEPCSIPLWLSQALHTLNNNNNRGGGKKYTNYNTAKPIWDQRGLPFCGRGWLKCFLPSNLKIAACQKREPEARPRENNGIAHRRRAPTQSPWEDF